MIRVLIAASVVLLVATFPATWLLMLFLGNLGLELSYWGTLPLGILVSTLLSGVSASSMALLATSTNNAPVGDGSLDLTNSRCSAHHDLPKRIVKAGVEKWL